MSINKKLRSLALSAALLAGIGTATTSQAVVLNNIDRLGDAGLFQYYTVNNGWQTFFRVINTSNEAVSIKVRFREAANSREVLDFTVFLSPYDMWSAWTDANALNRALLPGEAPHPGIRTNDTSCLLVPPSPNIVGEGFHPVVGGNGTLGAEFQSRAFTNQYADGSDKSVENRLKEGHMEVIGIARHGDITDFANAVRHNNGVPSDCSTARALFKAGSNSNGAGGRGWNLRNVLGFNGYLIQVDKGQGGGYDPDVLAFFANRSLTARVNATDTEVNLDSGSNFLFGSLGPNGTAFNNTITESGSFDPRLKQPGVQMNQLPPVNGPGPLNVTGSVDAVSAWLMRDTVSNEWAASSTNGIVSANSTQWVLTFPTKNYYVDLQDDPILTDDFSPTLVDPDWIHNDAYAPFSEEFGFNTTASCESFIMNLWDREEGHSSFTSPGPHETPELCYETNVLSFDEAFNGKGLDSNFAVTVPDVYFPPNGTKGWAQIEWTGIGATLDGLRIGSPKSPLSIHGLPVTGWMFTVYNTNSSSNNHAAINAHKYTRHFKLGRPGLEVQASIDGDDDETVPLEGGFFGQTNILGGPETE